MDALRAVDTLRTVGAIIGTEIRFNLKRVAPYLLFAFFCFNACLWWGGASVHYGWAPNSDYYIARLYTGFVFMTTPFFNALFMGDSIVRDYRYGVLPLLLTKPLSRAGYLAGKFIGNFLVFMGCCGGFALTLIVLQWTKLEGMIVLPWRVVPYIKHFLVLVVVFHLLLGAFCFTVGALTRSVKLVYGFIILLYLLFISLSASTQDSTSRWAWCARLVDPWLFVWGRNIGRNIRADVLNEMTLTYGGMEIANRSLMLSLSVLCLFILYRRFLTDVGEEKATGATVIRLGLSELADYLDNTSGWHHAKQTVLPVANRPAGSVDHEKGHVVVPLPAVVISHGGVWTRFRQFAAAVRMEFRLLLAERSLIILAPLVVLLCTLELNSYGGPFGAALFPLSSVYASNSARALIILLGGLTLFYTGEIFHRNRELKVEPLLWCLPVPDWLLLLRKYVAMLLLAVSLLLLFLLTALALQLYRGLAPIELRPYLVVYGVIVLPSIAFVIGLALALHVLLRDKYLAHASGIALGVGLFYLLGRGHTNWLYNPVLYRLWSYSDITGLTPYRTGLLLHRVYWGALTVAALGVAHIFFRRGAAKGWLQVFGYNVTGRVWAGALSAGALAVTLATGMAISGNISRGLEGEPREAAMALYEKKYARAYREAPAPDWRRVELQVELYPDEGRMRARGKFELTNRSAQEMPTVLVSLDPACRWQSVMLDNATRTFSPEGDGMAQVFIFETPLAPGATTNLHVEWDATIPEGLARTSSEYTDFIAAGGVLLGGPVGIEWLPASAYQRGWEITDKETRRARGLEPLNPLPELRDAPHVPPLFGSAPFDLRVEITVPADYNALSAGRLAAVRDDGARRTFVYESEHPVSGFPVLAARYAEKRRGGAAVYYHPQHAFNIEQMLNALTVARRQYERDYGPLPYRELRIAEFPRLASFAQSYPTIIPFSENLVFLTREDEAHVNSTYFSVAHEVAHQWFGGIVVPGRSRGASVLLEGLAEYAAGALIEDELGRDAAVLFRRHEEETYLRNRRADGEPPLIEVNDDYAAESPIFYQKAGLVFHMLENLLGRDAMNAALREYLERYGGRERHPTIHDLIAIFKKQSPEGTLNWFYEQWFNRVTLPDLRIESASVRREGEEYIVEFTLENRGEGKMPVTLEALAGAELQSNSLGLQVVLEQGKNVRGSLRCPFKPQRLVLDRMHNVIDAERNNNVFTL